MKNTLGDIKSRLDSEEKIIGLVAIATEAIQNKAQRKKD